MLPLCPAPEGMSRNIWFTSSRILGCNFPAGQRTAEQTHAAVDVKSYATRRDHAIVVRVRRRHPANGESITLMNVGHGERPPHDAGQHRHVDGLLERKVLQQILQAAFRR